jgi:hypothetical protein
MSEKCSPDDPRRCQGVTPHGQCEYLAVEGNKNCEYHSQGTGERKLTQKRVERYLIDNQDLRQSYLRQNNDAHYLDLKDEISLTHAMIERRLNAIKTDADVMMAVGPFTQLVQRLESMKISLMKLQQQLGLVLGKDELRQLASTMANVLDVELEGIEGKEEKLDRILEQIVVAIEEAGTKKEE